MIKNKSRLNTIGTFTLVMLSVSAILNLRNIPIMAYLGLHVIFIYSIAALCFLIPTALVSAELATKNNDNGGIYSWVKSAFGNKLGFVAIWLEWFNNIIAYPATLVTIVATLSFSGIPFLQNNTVMFFVMMVIFWGCTLFNLTNIKTSTKLNIIGALFGTILPGVMIILLALIWIILGNPINLDTSVNMIPDFNSSSLSLLVVAFSSYSGMQILAFHVKDIDKPLKTLPKAILISSITILFISIISALSIAVVVPHKDLNIINGVIEALSLFFNKFHLSFLVPILGVCIAIGGISSLSAWLLGPARSLHVVAKDGYLPAFLQKRNASGMPVSVLLLQGTIGTLFSSIYLFVPTFQDAFSLLVALTSQFTVMMFILVFISFIKLRYASLESIQSGFKIPFGMIGGWLVASVGIISCLIAFTMGIFPPESISQEFSKARYVSYIVIADTLIIGFPLLWIKISRLK